MKHLIIEAKRETAMRKSVYRRAIQAGSMTAEKANTNIQAMTDIATFLEDFDDRIRPFALFARRMHPDQDASANLLTIASDPRIDITAGDLTKIAGLYWRNQPPPPPQQELSI